MRCIIIRRHGVSFRWAIDARHAVIDRISLWHGLVSPFKLPAAPPIQPLIISMDRTCGKFSPIEKSASIEPGLAFVICTYSPFFSYVRLKYYHCHAEYPLPGTILVGQRLVILRRRGRGRRGAPTLLEESCITLNGTYSMTLVLLSL